MLNSRVAALTSGGFDSNVLLGEMIRKYGTVYPIYIRGGHVWEKAEIYWLRRFLRSLHSNRLKPLTVLTVPVTDLYRQGWQVTGRNVPGYRSRDQEVYLPGRNLLLLAKVATFCALRKIPTLAIGSLAGNPFPDSTHSFFARMGRVASDALGFQLRVIAPFSRLKKREVMKKGHGLPLHLSFSCLSPKGIKPCGRCNKCAERDRIKNSAI